MNWQRHTPPPRQQQPPRVQVRPDYKETPLCANPECGHRARHHRNGKCDVRKCTCPGYTLVISEKGLESLQ